MNDSDEGKIMHRCTNVLRTLMCMKKPKNDNECHRITYVSFDSHEYEDVVDCDAEIDVFSMQEYSNLKRKSRDIETETEEELLLLVFPGTAYDATSNGSLSSSVSLSDKSVSTDNNTVEEYVGDVPFAGM